MCRGQITLSKNYEICPLAILNQISKIAMRIPSLVKTNWYLLKLSSGNKHIDVSRADNCQKLMKFVHWQSQTRYLQYQCTHQFCWKSVDIYSSYRSETKDQERSGVMQVDNCKIDEICPLASNPKPDLHNINAHTKFGENLLTFTQGNENTEGRTLTDGRTNGHSDDQRETIIPRHYTMAGYKNRQPLNWKWTCSKREAEESNRHKWVEWVQCY